jgi:hypothetical protein
MLWLAIVATGGERNIISAEPAATSTPMPMSIERSPTA